MDLTKNGFWIYKLNGISLVYVFKNGVTAFTCVPEGTEDMLSEEKLLKLAKSIRYTLSPRFRIKVLVHYVSYHFAM